MYKKLAKENLGNGEYSIKSAENYSKAGKYNEALETIKELTKHVSYDTNKEEVKITFKGIEEAEIKYLLRQIGENREAEENDFSCSQAQGL